MPIRRATEDDVEAIRSVARASWTADYPTILSRETADTGVDEWYNPAHLRAELARPATVVLVAEVDEGERGRGDDDGHDSAVVGFVHALRNREEGVIFRVYVHPDYRHAGVGSDLLARSRDELADRGVERLTAMVLAENEVGRGFYEAFGFEKVGEDETTIGGESYPEFTYSLGL